MTYSYKVLKKVDIRQFMKRKSISDSRSVENISEKRLRTKVQSAQSSGVERIKRFVNVHLHCIASNLKRISIISTFPPGKISAGARGCPDFDITLGSLSVVLFASDLHSKTTNAEVVSPLTYIAY